MFFFQLLFLFVACRTYTLRDYPQAVLGFSALDCLFDFFCGLKMAQCFESCGTLKESDDQNFLLFLLMDCIFFLHLDQKKWKILRDKKIQVSNWSSDWKTPWKKKGSSPSRFLVNGKGLFPPPTFKITFFTPEKGMLFFKTQVWVTCKNKEHLWYPSIFKTISFDQKWCGSWEPEPVENPHEFKWMDWNH